MNLGPAVGTREDGAEGDDEDVGQGVKLAVVASGVFQISKVIEDGQLSLAHGGTSGRWVSSRPTNAMPSRPFTLLSVVSPCCFSLFGASPLAKDPLGGDGVEFGERLRH